MSDINTVCVLSQPYCFVQNKEEKSTICSICLEKYKNQYELVSVLFCTHMFHTDCIEKWFTKNKVCPLCRSVHPV